MNLFEIDPETRLPVASAEARTIPEFKEIVKRKRPIEGDFDGRKKLLNEQELAFVYFMCKYDSRFKLLKGEDKILAVKELIGLPKDWLPDEVVNSACDKYSKLQITESTRLAEVLGESIMQLTTYAENTNKQLGAATLVMADDVAKYLSILDKIPQTVEKLRQVKETLNREQEALEKGRKGRMLNKFEMPD